MADLREDVARAMQNAAIRTVVERLIEEAEADHGGSIVYGIPDMTGDLTYGEGVIDGYLFSAWLRAYLPTEEGT